MAVTQDIVAQLTSYRGLLGWAGFTNGRGDVIPAIEVELFIKEHPIPIRKPKITEVNTLLQKDPGSGLASNTQAIFLGAPDPLTLNLSGWIITPRTAVGGGQYKYDPKALSGTSLNWGNISNAEVITAFLGGRVDVSAAGLGIRRDPDYYVSPQGSKYSYPTVMTWNPSYTVSQKKVAFTMTLGLET